MNAKSQITGSLALVVFVGLPLALAGLAGANLVRLAATEDVIGRQQALIGEIDRRLGRLGNGGAVLDTSSIYLKAGGAAIAAADLQRMLTADVRKAGGSVVESQVEPPPDGAPADQVSLRLTVDIDNGGLAGLLGDIEGGLPLLFVDAASIRELDRGGGTDATEPRLRAELTIRAAWKQP